MTRNDSRPGARGLLRVLLLSVAAATVPIAGVFLYPEELQSYEALTWLLLLVPAFLWAYERGWRGVATALASGMAALSVTYAVSQSLGGSLPPLLLPVIVAYVAVSLGIGLFGDRVAKAQYAAAAETLALQDRLTGLANRRRVELHLDLQFAIAERGYPLAVVLFDIDRLSAYNLRHGRSAGDGVLKGFGSLLRRQTRRMDLAARFGPDEFLVVLAGVPEEGAVVFTARVQEQLRAAEQTVALPTVSAGIACYRSDAATPHELIAAAEEALRQAKEDGRDRVRIHGRRLDELGEPDARGMAETSVRELRSSSAAARRLMGAGRSALVLSADSSTRARLTGMLSGEGFDVVQSGEAAEIAASLQHDCDVVLVDIAPDADAMAALVADIRYRSPATRVIGIAPADAGAALPGALKVRVDGHYAAADDQVQFLRQLEQLLHERDELLEAQLRQHQLSHELRSRDRELRGALAASEARYRALLDSVSDIVFTADMHGRWTSLNPAWTAMTGVAVADALGRPMTDAIHEDDRVTVQARVADVLHDAPFHRLDVRLRCSNGAFRLLELRLEPTHTPDGELTGIAGMLANTHAPDAVAALPLHAGLSGD